MLQYYIVHREFAQTLSDVDVSTLTKLSSSKKKNPNLHPNTDKHPNLKIKQTFHGPKVDSDEFRFGSFNMGHFKAYESIWNHVKSHGKKGFGLPKVNTLVSTKDFETVMLKHQLRQEAIGEICLPHCDINDMACNCEILFDCVRKIDEYDLAVLAAKGYIDTSPGSENYGAFGISAKNLNLFNLDQNLRRKLEDIRGLVDSSSSSDRDQCISVLGKFKRALPCLGLDWIDTVDV
jgi:hypothetical protein